MNNIQQNKNGPAILPDSNGRFGLCPTVMTEEKLIQFLRIPEISSANNHRHVIENLKRKHGLPRIHLCAKTVYLTDSVKQWLQQRVICGHQGSVWYNGSGPTQALGRHRKGGYANETVGKAEDEALA